MKKLLKYLSFLAFATIIVACNKEIEESNANYEALDPANIDLGAGNWKPIIVAINTSFPVPVPSDINSSVYKAEIADLKIMSSNLSAEQKRVINYWKVGSVLRWNEIMRELVAKHNLPPYQNADNTYPVPSAANPFAYPEFPFSNPPYAARAYAYVSSAQYDALIFAHKYKAQFNRAAPYKADANLQVSVPKSDLPSYPSEDAVIAGASFEMMKLLFPSNLEFITKMAEEEKNYRLWSGANVKSDIIAGDSLGRWVARIIVQRAKTDGMGTAGGNAGVWKKLEDDCKVRGETPWYSLENPKRPPMLPLFGNVKPLLFAATEVPLLRAVPPPASTSPQMRKELDEVLGYVKSNNKEYMRIVNFWADGAGTYTPPGHWNAIATAEFINKKYSEVRWARNYALLNAALMDAAIVCWNTKYFYFNARPCQLDPTIKTLTGVPNFPAYVSGHSTFSASAAQILSYLVPQKANNFKAMAKEASESRIYGGIHYRSDCEEGLRIGQNIGQFAVERAKIDGAN